ncbi:hypothetical protein ACFQL4_22315 [Halosimplex aquaticum]
MNEHPDLPVVVYAADGDEGSRARRRGRARSRTSLNPPTRRRSPTTGTYSTPSARRWQSTTGATALRSRATCSARCSTTWGSRCTSKTTRLAT